MEGLCKNLQNLLQEAKNSQAAEDQQEPAPKRQKFNPECNFVPSSIAKVHGNLCTKQGYLLIIATCADQDIGSCILEIENQSYNGIDEIDFQILAKCVVSLRFLLWSRRRVKRLPHSARAGGNCRML